VVLTAVTSGEIAVCVTGVRAPAVLLVQCSPDTSDLGLQLAAWMGEHLEELAEAEPVMPVEDRAADTWEPLMAVADLAGGAWPQRARKAALLFVSQADEADAEASLSMRLLADIRHTFTDYTVSFLSSQQMLIALGKIEDSPWHEDYLTTTKLAQMLRPYGIKRRRNAAGTARGYRRRVQGSGGCPLGTAIRRRTRAAAIRSNGEREPR
jgi:hypothetical protein